MSLDCLLGYIYFDSLCRSLHYHSQVDSLLALSRGWDTMKVFMRLMYRMQEYDADLFSEYMLAATDLNTSYHMEPAVVTFEFHDTMRSVLGQYNKLAYMVNAPVILHIHVVDTGSSADSGAAIPMYPLPMKCITASVVQAIKGQHIRCTSLGLTQIQKHVMPQDNPCYIHITYSPYWQKLHSRGDVNAVGISSSGQAHISCDSCFGQAALEAGKDYIVFLEDGELDYDGTHAFYEYSPFTTYSNEGGIFPIDSNQNVLIPSNFFGYGTSVPLVTFLSDLQTDLNTFLNH
jgi:hypothetical protein